MVPGITPDAFAREIIRAYITSECKGKLHRIGQSYVERAAGSRLRKKKQSDLSL